MSKFQGDFNPAFRLGSECYDPMFDKEADLIEYLAIKANSPGARVVSFVLSKLFNVQPLRVTCAEYVAKGSTPSSNIPRNAL